MSSSICVNRQTVAVKEYQGNRVVTLKDIDLVHGRPEGTARKRFNDNKKRFIEGFDYFVRNSDEAQATYGIVAPRGLILITESGYLMLVKSFTDDLSWKVQRELVNNYFRVEAEEPYEYIDKSYKGIPVMSTADVAHFTGIARGTLRYYLEEFANDNMDFFKVKGETLRAFKKENPKVNRLSNSMVLITRSGFVKICEAYGVKVKEDVLKLFPASRPMLAPPELQKPERLYALPFDTPEIQRLTALLQDELTTIKTLLFKLNRHNIEIGDFSNMQKTLGRLGVEICSDLHRLEWAKPKTSDRLRS